MISELNELGIKVDETAKFYYFKNGCVSIATHKNDNTSYVFYYNKSLKYGGYNKQKCLEAIKKWMVENH